MRSPSGSPTKCRPVPIRLAWATPVGCTGSIDTTAGRSYGKKSPVPASGGASPWRCCRCCRSSGFCEPEADDVSSLLIAGNLSFEEQRAVDAAKRFLGDGYDHLRQQLKP